MKLPRLFRRTDPPSQVKESAVGSALVMTPGQPVWSGRDYAAFAEEAYRRNVVAYQAINRIADAVASVKWCAFSGDDEIERHPILDLIRRPNPAQSGPQYIRAKVGYLMIAGNGYEERVTVGNQVRELYQLRPDRVKIIPAANGYPAGYIYSANSKAVRFPVDDSGNSDLRHLKMFNPSNDWYGMSPVEAGAYAIDQSNEAMKWVQSLLQNSARPSGALTTKDGAELSDDNFARLKAQIEEQYSGAINAGRPMLLEGGLSWEQMGLSPSDMALLETKFSAARDICLCFGVPPQLLGIPGDNTYSNYQEARLSFWEDTVIPLLDLIAADWSAWLGEPYGITLKPDLEDIPAIVDKRQSLWAMADASLDLTINERRAMKGYEPIAGGDVLYVSMGQIPLTDLSMPIESDPEAAAAEAYGNGEPEPPEEIETPDDESI
jgi:HK97 family phage portal protein